MTKLPTTCEEAEAHAAYIEGIVYASTKRFLTAKRKHVEEMRTAYPIGTRVKLRYGSHRAQNTTFTVTAHNFRLWGKHVQITNDKSGKPRWIDYDSIKPAILWVEVRPR